MGEYADEAVERMIWSAVDDYDKYKARKFKQDIEREIMRSNSPMGSALQRANARPVNDDDLRAIAEQVKQRGKPAFFGGKKMKTLYRYNGVEGAVPHVGERLAIDGNRWIMKRLSDGQIDIVDPSVCEEVLPYTVDVVFIKDSAGPLSFFAVDGSVAVGDLLLLPGYSTYAEVVAVDTKSRKATKPLAGWVVANKKLPEVKS